MDRSRTKRDLVAFVPAERIERRILLVRRHTVMLDSDLAALYGVTTGNLNKAVTRNLRRFPLDFMFQLGREEYRSLRFQIGILEKGRHSKYLPRVFTEQGVAMLSSVLNSERAVQVNIAIMRAFVRLRELLAAHKHLARRLEKLEKRHDAQFKIVFALFRKLMAGRRRVGGRPIGFLAGAH